jgi:hypothetical protein
MKTIYKYELLPKKATPTVEVGMPSGALVLSVGTQTHIHQGYEEHEGIFVWAEVDTTAPMVIRTFEVYGTGHPMTTTTKAFIGTVHFQTMPLVFHIYEQVR